MRMPAMQNETIRRKSQKNLFSGEPFAADECLLE